MITIELLAHCPHHLPKLVDIWYEGLGKIWMPDVSLEKVKERFQLHLHENTLPLTLVANIGNQPVGMASLRKTDGIRPELTPWLGGLVVTPTYQKQGIAQQLMNAVENKASELSFEELYLLTFDKTLPQYYKRHGWLTIGEDELHQHPVTIMHKAL